MIDQFTREEFEEALPRHRETNVPLWKSAGCISNEFAYLVPVHEHASIMIRSSVKSDGMSAGTGEDSIRMWLVDPETLDFVGSKLSTYVTRVPGWQDRMTDMMRELFRMGRFVTMCSCGEGIRKIFKTKKDGNNKGRLFLRCNSCESFEWIPTPFQPKAIRKRLSKFCPTS